MVSLDAPVATSEGEMRRDVAADTPGPEAMFLEGEARSEIEQAIHDLPDKYREPLVLRHAAEMSYDEISEALELPLGTVKTRIFRAREALRVNLGRSSASVVATAHGADGR
jgi:RNA polymerase sigma-70 factor (ECF subfamily)